MPDQNCSGDKFHDISAIDSRLADLEQEKQQLIALRAELQTSKPAPPISDSFSPGLAGSNDTGVLLPRYQAESFEREISVEFKMFASSPQHLVNKWNKIRRLVAIAQPSEGQGTVTSLTIGDLYRDLPVVCTGVETGWDDETTWEIHPGLQAPMLTNCSATFKVLSAEITYFNNGQSTNGATPADGFSSWNTKRNKHIS